MIQVQAWRVVPPCLSAWSSVLVKKGGVIVGARRIVKAERSDTFGHLRYDSRYVHRASGPSSGQLGREFFDIKLMCFGTKVK